mgnify:FL=1
MPIPKGYAYKAFNPDTGLLAEYRELIQSTAKAIWENGMCNELGRLFQGFKPNKIVGTDTGRFIHPNDMPKGRKATYVRVLVAHRPQKTEENRVRLTVGGDKVDYPGPVSSKTTDLITAKLLLNSVVSTPNAMFLGLDIKDFFLGTPLLRKEYAKIAVKLIPKAFMDLYNLWDYVVDGYVWFEISRGMYGLPQASRLAYDALVPRLAKAGYREAGITPGLFKHDTNKILFCLTVDDFGVQYPDYATAQHLVRTLKEHYEITEDWKGEKYCGLDLVWSYEDDERWVDVSINGYVKKALQRFAHEPPSRPQHSPSQWTKPQYGAKIQMAKPADESPKLDKEQIRLLQEIIGVFLFYARAVDNTMLVALGTIRRNTPNKRSSSTISQLRCYPP